MECILQRSHAHAPLGNNSTRHVRHHVSAEQHVRAVAVEVHGHVDGLALGRRWAGRFPPDKLAHVEGDGLAVVEHQPAAVPRRTVELEAWLSASSTRAMHCLQLTFNDERVC